MTAVGWLPADAEELFGTDATAEESYDVLTVDVPPAAWISALETARDRLGCTYFDWLSAVDEPGTGFRVAAHVAALSPVRRLLLRTTVPHESPVLPTAVAVYAGAAWHERETHEMFGVVFEGHPALDHLLLPEGFEGHPLRKDFVLAARVAKAWPGAKEPGESDHGGPRRRQMLPPGVPDPNEWGPLKGQLPPAPARPARGAARAAGDRPARAAGERPVRRTRTAAQATPDAEAPATARRSRTAAEGSVSQAAPDAQPPSSTPSATRRARSASEGSASQRTGGAAAAAQDTGEQGPTGQDTAPSGAPAARRARSAAEGSASQRAGSGGAAGARSAAENSVSRRTASDEGPSGDGGETDVSPAAPKAPKPAPTAPRSPDAPWHHARPAFDEPAAETQREPEPRRADEAQPEARGGQQGRESRDGQDGRDAQEDRDGQDGGDAQEDRDGQDGRHGQDDPTAQDTEDRQDPQDRQNPPGGPQ
ncbi:dehydrogenase [Streptomyces viridiviolaceus]|uniref:NADH-quinone oxidoreductase subunit C n=1 Tax=Streptomyces viridiviolaceus TaxID=68282 RepID=A0ABW2E279_9ACTN|nr:NADH-quinone oxidoreductase subunit C [Streptomyces viridiviolaceus]GHB55416.1 dehydrogenase [Streptomyces viridiviolaceus]